MEKDPLWTFRRSGSIGRLRVICEREDEIEAFKPREYWSIEALLSNLADNTFSARLHSCDGKKLTKFAIENEQQAETILAELKQAEYQVTSLERRHANAIRHLPSPPVPCSRKRVANSASRRVNHERGSKLYEGIEVADGTHGLITYMRTDSVALSDVATTEAREVICHLYDESYALKKPRVFRNKSKKCPGSARSDPSDFDCQNSDRSQKVFKFRSTEAVRTDLEKNRRITDGAGNF